VDSSETYAARLDAMQRDRRTTFELVNGAYPGDSAVIGRFKLGDRILPLDPDVLLLAFSANNAFRTALQSDAERLRAASVRRFALRSRLLLVLASRVANAVSRAHPRDREEIARRRLAELRRVADLADFANALRDTVMTARAAGVQPLFLLLPRAHQVSRAFAYEDAALQYHRGVFTTGGGEAGEAERNALELSCLEVGHEDAIADLRASIGSWQAVWPEQEGVRATLRFGAAAWIRGDRERAAQSFQAALAQAPDSPIARYDLGVAEIAAGKSEWGLRRLEAAGALACNVFLQYQVAVHELAVELDVPVVDMVVRFQAFDAAALYLDPAHPSPRGHELIAEALWPQLQKLLGETRPER
jgi:lysophospholipase L1-like esterase